MTLRARLTGAPLLALALGALGCSDAVPLADQLALGAAGAQSTAGVGGATGGTGGRSGGTGGAMAGAGGTSGAAQSCVRGEQVLKEDGVVNARDLGGIPLEGGGTVKCGLLFRGAPLTLTPDGCGSYQELGVRVVVDLRQEHERAGRPDATCATEDANVIAAPLPIPYQVSGENYIADLNTLDSMALVFHALGTQDGYPMYFHCTYGRDRTAVVAAVILSALGASREAIMADYELSREAVGAYPASLVATLDELDRRGGVEAYYAELGVTSAELSFLREYATAP